MRHHYMRGLLDGRPVEVGITTRQMMAPCDSYLVGVTFLDTEQRITTGESLSVETMLVQLGLIQSDPSQGELSI